MLEQQHRFGHLVVALHVPALLALLPVTVIGQTAADAPPPASAEVAPAPPAAPAEAPKPAPTEAPKPAPVEAPKPAPAEAPKPEEPVETDPTKGHILDGTGYLLPARTVEFGLFYMGYGITDWLNIGTSPGMWVVGPLLGGVVANASVKLGLPITRWVNVGLEGSPIFLHLNHNDSKVRGFVLPLTLAASVNVTASQDYTLGFRYVGVTGKDETDTENQDVEGAAVVQVAQLLADGRIRFGEKFALYGRAYYQLWEQNLGANGVYQPDDSTTIEVEGEADANEESRPWAVILGAQFRFGAVNLRLGLGYGNYFVPRIGVFTAKKIIIPDLDFYVRF